jgi:TrpR-related protein YerC/YecD
MKHSLEKAILTLEDEKNLEKFLHDLLSPKEYESLKERWNVVQLLEKGIPYREISETTGVSTATVTRVARCLSASGSGYQIVLELLKSK